MRKNYFLPAGLLLTGFMFLLLASCTDDDKNNQDIDNGNQTVKAVTNALTSGYLDTLAIDRAPFDLINGNRTVFFSFVFKTADTLTLHGWIQKGNNFDSLPNLKLTNRGATTASYGPGTYFGNIVIRPDDFGDIKNALIDNRMKYVLFVPRKDGNNILYDILVTSDDPTNPVSILVTTDTGADGNPSPPKNYN
jgi:hypothetical protein